MITVIFESHATTVDNENRVCSGHFDAKLSELGKKQAKELGERHADETFDAIFCSDLSRSYDTAEIAFAGKYPVIQDARLRECDYGDFEHCSRDVMDGEQFNRISEPFPSGESYEQAYQRMSDFLADLRQNYAGQRVMIIGHGATRGALEHFLGALTIKDSILAARTWKPAIKFTA